jgi:hypothetical protein
LKIILLVSGHIQCAVAFGTMARLVSKCRINSQTCKCTKRRGKCGEAGKIHLANWKYYHMIGHPNLRLPATLGT